MPELDPLLTTSFLVGVLAAGVRLAVPTLLAALGEIVTERAGVLNLGLEGIMLAGAFTASPWAYNGKIFCLSEEGVTYVIQAGPEFRVLAKNSLDEVALATPAIARGSLLIRTATKLYRLSRPAP